MNGWRTGDQLKSLDDKVEKTETEDDDDDDSEEQEEEEKRKKQKWIFETSNALHSLDRTNELTIDKQQLYPLQMDR